MISMLPQYMVQPPKKHYSRRILPRQSSVSLRCAWAETLQDPEFLGWFIRDMCKEIQGYIVIREKKMEATI